ncbi:unnamed protein product [Vitrella brassicaformis CCMP3155]|uniref:Uncharacterized protein n=4 Tax=Vitrella brassicaformis TaxID=1169539 RepID=A0A0G4GG76_VITBC|nr:unnamed protein product [Vitrella brassicaformis CCMP3155]|eukprot:CEM28618.1 unnamed protein product [Vitrella brassicaformis CCMP3155]
MRGSGLSWFMVALLVTSSFPLLHAQTYTLVFDPDPPPSVALGDSLAVDVQVHNSLLPGLDTGIGGMDVLLLLKPAVGGCCTSTVGLFGARKQGISLGVATFTGLSINEAGEYILEAFIHDSPPGGATVAGNSSSFVVDQVPDRLAFRQAPTSGIAGQPFADMPIVAVRDSPGNRRVRTYTGDIHLFFNGPAGFTVTGITTQTAVKGIAQFSSLTVDTPGSYTITAVAQDPGITAATTASFTVLAGTATALAFSTQPVGDTGGQVLSTSPVVQAVDSTGAPDTTFNSPITVTLLTSGPLLPPGAGQTTCGGLTMVGTKTVGAAPSATFNDLAIDRAGTFRLQATAHGLTTGISDPFTVAVGIPAGIVFTLQPPPRVTVGSNIQIDLQLVDAGGNDWTTTPNRAVTLDLWDPSSGSYVTLGGLPTPSCTTSSGACSIATVRVPQAGSSLQLRARVTADTLEQFSSFFDASFDSGIEVTDAGGTCLSPHATETSPPTIGMTYRLRLTRPPIDDVDITPVEEGGPTYLTFAPTTLTFTDSDYATHQTVAVTVTNFNVRGPAVVTVTHTLTSTDPAYAQNVPQWTAPMDATGRLQLTISGDDGPHLVRLSPWAVQVREGASTTYGIYLDAEPAAPIEILISPPSKVTVSDRTVTILPTDWTAPGSAAVKTITVTPVRDIVKGATSREFFNIQHHILSSGGEGLSPTTGDVTVAVLEADAEVVLVDPVALVAVEGNSVSFAVALNTPATGTVTVTTTCDGTYTQVAGGSPLTFNSGNWAVRQTVDIITLVEDDDTLFDTVACTLGVTGYASAFEPSETVSVTVVHQICPLGTFGPDCAPCPVGSACFAGDVSTCYPGETMHPNKHICIPCPPEYMCPTADVEPFYCEAGTYALGNATECSPCPRGSACPGRGMDPVPCPPGWFSIENSTSCTACPKGHYCDDPAVMPVACATGEYAMGQAIECISCPPGFFCPDPTRMPQACPRGTYSEMGETNCTSCPAGESCLEPFMSPPTQTCQLGTCSLAGDPECRPCPRGYHCPNKDEEPVACEPGQISGTGSTTCDDCPVGHRCPAPWGPARECELGEWAPARSTKCDRCLPGNICATTHNAVNPLGDEECPIGFYCEPGLPRPCPAGYYNDLPGQGSLDNCKICTAGKYCPAGSVAADHDCLPGYFCPEGSKNPGDLYHACPGGTYNPSAAQGTAPPVPPEDDCLACAAGILCLPASKTNTMLCPYGYYCENSVKHVDYLAPAPAGKYTGKTGGRTSDADMEDCPRGAYCPEGSSYPLLCPPGTFNPDQNEVDETACDPCTAGYACPFAGMTAGNTVKCATGHYCPEGTRYATQFPCPRGTYTDSENLAAESSCDPCPAGKACDFGTGGTSKPPQPCAPGYYCPTGADTGTQYRFQYPCPAGTMSNGTDLTSDTECGDCPEGLYCTGGKPFADGRCPKGYKCPPGTQYATQFPCDAGSYGDRTGLPDQANCTACPNGHYCVPGTVRPIPCPAGSYAQDSTIGGAEAAGSAPPFPCIPCDAGNFCPTGSVDPIPCGVGYFSPQGASQCLKCPKGHYCDSATTDETTMLNTNLCPAGTLCPYEGMDHVPDTTTDPCPSGHYCLLRPTPCAAGYYNPNNGSGLPTACIAADPGTFVEREGLSAPSGKCAPHHYCDQSPDPATSPTEKPCTPGTFNFAPGAVALADCTDCPAGYYCPMEYVDGVFSTHPFPCPEGHFCDPRTSDPSPCPTGTYRHRIGAHNQSECVPCPGGRFCDTTGLIAPSGPCDAGYLCIIGSDTPQPNDTVMGDVCTPGGYCQQGTTVKEVCEPGFYNPDPGGRTVGDCIQCPAGQYCSGSNLNTPSGPCDPGYYCTGTSGLPTQFETGPGQYSESGAAFPENCLPGTYNHMYKQSACLPCPARYYCPEETLTAPVQCLPGFFCQPGAYTFTECPQGTYGAFPSRSSATECFPCDPGYFCDASGKTTYTGPCAAGFYCTGGSLTDRPELGDIHGGPCPQGHYCPPASTQPIPCPMSTYNPSSRKQADSDCLTCPSGKYCASMALTAPEGDCDAGWFCPDGSTSPKTTVCDWGEYCVAGSGANLTCPAGEYNNAPGADSCDPCPYRFWCPSGTYNFTENLCPKGHYCGVGTSTGTQFPCDAGRFNNVTGAYKTTECQQCPPGKYCDTSGLEEPTGDCDPGYYCQQGSESATPTGNECAAGTYCPAGTPDFVPCDAGYFCNDTGLASPTDICDGGYYCEEGAKGRTSAEDSGNVIPCPAGSYCEPGSTFHRLCPNGTFSSATNQDERSDCQDCMPGKYCAEAGLTAPSGDCEAGFYCPAASVWKYGILCPAGKKCPSGSATPQSCDTAAEYQPLQGQADCVACPPGRLCNDTDSVPCPEGHFCAGNVQTACGPGSYNNFTGGWKPDNCTACPPGRYCDSSAMTAPGPDCPAGYFCRGETPVEFPLDPATDNGGGCEKGYYCPPGSTSQLDCLPGQYCSVAFAAAPTALCAAGFFCKQRALTAQPLVREDRKCPSARLYGICPEGHYCEEGTADSVRCPAGTKKEWGGVSSTSGARNVLGCSSCQAGSYCHGTALTVATSGVCVEGYYCPAGSKQAREKLCPPGHYCGEASGDKRQCEKGQYQPLYGQTTCDPCVAGQSCEDFALDHTQECEQGMYCQAGDKPKNCPIGTFGNDVNLTALLECTDCLPGQYCGTEGLDAPTANCSAGYYCRSGSERAKPDAFSPGYKCLGGDQRFCSPGRGCPKGSYCPEGSVAPIPCRPGKNSPNENATSPADCADCPPGKWCAPDGSISNCDGGFVCVGSSATPRPTNQTGMGYRCPSGHKCAAGVFAPTECQPGSFADMGLDDCKDCQAGFVCSDTQQDTTDTYPCPEGHYCPRGSDNGLSNPCPSTTFRNLTHGALPSDCFDCPAGEYCPIAGQNDTAGACSAGYVCVGGDYSATPTGFWPNSGQCPAGFYCPEGTDRPVPCPIATWQGSLGADRLENCTGCPAGHYCPETNLLDYRPYKCAAGNATTPTPRNLGGGTPHCDPHNSTTCTIDPGGQCANTLTGEICDITPTTSTCTVTDACNNQTGECHTVSYDCTLTGTLLVDGVTPCGYSGDVCDPEVFNAACNLTGDICTIDQAACDDAKTEFELEAACGVSGDLCPEGHYCPQNATSGCDVPIPCPGGSYANRIGMDACIQCPKGNYCPEGSVWPQPCPENYFCNVSTAEPYYCPNGTWSNFTELEDPSNCTEALKAEYSQFGQMQGSCSAGHLCIMGVNTSTPLSFADERFGEPAIQYGGLCPSGHYCEEGTVAPTPCPEGTGVAWEGASSEDNCTVCPPGYYCGDFMLVPAECPPGFFCGENTTDPIPCPIGTYNNQSKAVDTFVVEAESITNVSVSAVERELTVNYTDGALVAINLFHDTTNGSVLVTHDTKYPEDFNVTYVSGGGGGGADVVIVEYESTTTTIDVDTSGPSMTVIYTDPVVNPDNSTTCLPCPAGYWCHNITDPLDPGPGISDYRPFVCPISKYCPLYTLWPKPCPQGTYRNDTGAAAESDCFPCPLGFYCDNDANTFNLTYVPCPAGYYCNDPNGTVLPVPCPQGFYCPVQTIDPVPCDEVSVYGIGCNEVCRVNLTDDLEKPEDSLACLNNIMPVNMTTTPAPPTANDTEAFFPPSECGASGYYCPSPALSQPVPVVRALQTTTQADLDDAGSSIPIPCPYAHYCPRGSGDPTPCPPGTKARKSCHHGVTLEDCCEACPRGTYTAGNASLECTECDAGYVCTGGGVIPAPTSLAEGGKQCPAGHYCPAGATWEIPCSPGAFNPDILSTSAASCRLCPQDTFNDHFGQSSCITCGATSYSLVGASACTCLGRHRAFQRSDKTCRCAPGYEFLDVDFNRVEGDGGFDCQPKILARCGASELRNADGECVGKKDCKDVCIGTPGEYIATIGLCQCEALELSNVECDQACRDDKFQMALVPSSDKGVSLRVTDPATQTSVEIPISVLQGGALGGGAGPMSNASFIACDIDDRDLEGATCDLKFQGASNTALLGLFGPPVAMLDVIDQLYAELEALLQNATVTTPAPTARMLLGQEMLGKWDKESVALSRVKTRYDANGECMFRRRLQAVVADEGINNPVQCLEYGTAMVWQLDDGRYPVYVKDSLLNSNANFDYRAFDLLRDDMRSANPPSIFVYTFNQEGSYTFRKDNDPQKQTVIVVMGQTKTCPDDSDFPQATTAPALLRLGVRQRDDIVIAPDWWIVLIVTICVVAMFIVLVSALRNYRKRQWARATKGRSEIRYRSHAQKADFSVFGSKGGQVEVNRVEDAANVNARRKSYFAGTEEADMEELAEREEVQALSAAEIQDALQDYSLDLVDPRVFQAIFEKILDHYDFTKKQFNEHQEYMHESTKLILSQTEQLQEALAQRLKAAVRRQEIRDEEVAAEKHRLAEIFDRLTEESKNVPERPEDVEKFMEDEATGRHKRVSFIAPQEAAEEEDTGKAPGALCRPHTQMSRASSMVSVGLSELDLQDHAALLEEQLELGDQEKEILQKLEQRVAEMENEEDRAKAYNELNAEMEKVRARLDEEKMKILSEVQERTNARQQRTLERRRTRKHAEQELAELYELQDAEIMRLREKSDREFLNEEQKATDELMELEAKLQAEGEAKKQELYQEFQYRLAAAKSPHEKEIIIRHFKQNLEALNEALEEEAEKQRLALAEKLRKRQEERKKTQKEDTEKVLKNQTKAANAAELAVIDRRLDEIATRHANEREILQESEDLHIRKEQAALEKWFDRRKKEKLGALYEQIMGPTPPTDEAEKEKLLSEYETRAARLEEELAEEKEEQELMLLQKMKERTKRRQAAQEARRRAEVQLIHGQRSVMDKRNALEERIQMERLGVEADYSNNRLALQQKQEMDLNEKLRDLNEKMVTALKVQALQDEANGVAVLDREKNANAIKQRFERDKQRILQDHRNLCEEQKQDLLNAHRLRLEELRQKHKGERDECNKEISDELQALHAKIDEATKEELSQRKNAAEEAVNDEAEREEMIQLEDLQAKTEMDKIAMLKKEESKLQEALREAPPSERQELIEQHEKNIKRLQDLMEEEQHSQAEALKAQLAERRKRRLAAVSKRTEAETEMILIRREQENDAAALQLEAMAEAQEYRDDVLTAHEENRQKRLQGRENDIHKATEKLRDHIQAQPAADEGERQALLSQWRAEIHTAWEQHEESAQQQAAQLKTRLEARRKRIAIQQRQKAAEQRAKHTEARQELRKVVEGNKEAERHIQAAGAEAALESQLQAAIQKVGLQKMKEQQQAEMEELQHKHREDAKKAKQEWEAELSRLKEELEEEKEEVKVEEEVQITKLKEDLEANLAVATTQGEKERLMEEHQAQVAEITAAIEREENRQKEQLEKKLQARREKLRMQQEKLLQQQQQEMAERELQQAKALEELQRQLGRQAQENMTVFDTGDSEEEAFGRLKGMLESRHQQETNSRVALHYREKTVKLKAAMDALQVENQHKIMELNSQYGQLIAEAESQAEETGSMEHQLAADDLKKEKEEKSAELRAALDEEYEGRMAEQRRVIELEQAEDLMTLRENQLFEVLEQIASYIRSGLESAIKWQEEADEEKSKIEGIRRQKRDEAKNRLQEIEQAMKQREEEARQEIEKQMAELQAQLEREREKARQAAEEKMKAQKAKLREERRRQHEKNLERMKDAGGEVKDAILEQHQAEIQALEQNLDVERARQLEKMNQRLIDRKRKKEAALQQQKMEALINERRELQKQQEQLQKQEEREQKRKEEILAKIRRKSTMRRVSKKWHAFVRERRKSRTSPAAAKKAPESPKLQKKGTRHVQIMLEDDEDEEEELMPSPTKPPPAPKAAPTEEDIAKIKAREQRRAQITKVAGRVKTLIGALFVSADKDKEEEAAPPPPPEGEEAPILERRSTRLEAQLALRELPLLIETFDKVGRLIMRLSSLLGALGSEGGGPGPLRSPRGVTGSILGARGSTLNQSRGGPVIVTTSADTAAFRRQGSGGSSAASGVTGSVTSPPVISVPAGQGLSPGGLAVPKQQAGNRLAVGQRSQNRKESSFAFAMLPGQMAPDERATGRDSPELRPA